MNVRALLAGVLGLLMVAATADGVPEYALPLCICAAILALTGVRYPSAATLAVLVSIGILALRDAPPIQAALAGLAAATFLLTAYPLRWPATVIAVRGDAMLPALLFAGAALVASAIPVQQSSWLPLTVPVAVVLIYVGSLLPIVRRDTHQRGRPKT